MNLGKGSLVGPPVEKENWLFLFLPFPNHFKIQNVRIKRSVQEEHVKINQDVGHSQNSERPKKIFPSY